MKKLLHDSLDGAKQLFGTIKYPVAGRFNWRELGDALNKMAIGR